MGDEGELASRLARSCPPLAADWAKTSADLDLRYVALGHLAARLIRIDTKQPGIDFQPLFDEVEALLAGGDRATRNLVVVGFLEAVQNQGGTLQRWGPLLGTESRTAWTALADVWAGRITPETFNKLTE